MVARGTKNEIMRKTRERKKTNLNQITGGFSMKSENKQMITKGLSQMMLMFICSCLCSEKKPVKIRMTARRE